MTDLILIAGLPGTGKTSFARYLSAKMKIPMISKDLIKEQLFDTAGFKNRQEKVNLGTAAMAIMYHIADLHLEIGLPIILENNFENVSKPGLLKLIEKHNCNPVMVKFHTEMSVLAERFRIRDQSPQRHRGHVVNTQYPEVSNNLQKEIYLDNAEFNWKKYYSAMHERGMDTFSIGCPEIPADSTDFSRLDYEKIFIEILAKIIDK